MARQIWRRLRASPHLVALGGIVALGGVLRFATLDLQSFRYDEAVTAVRVLHPNFFNTVSSVANSESTPPLYYTLAWLWSRVFGTGEVGLRSLSALAGTASIVVIYLGALAMPLSRRAALIAAAIVATSPVLIWFSQDARAYALVFLLAALSFWFFARARRSGAARDLAWWAIFSALAISTHYFAGFLIVPEAAILLWAAPRRRVAAALAVVVSACLLLLPIALQQSENAHGAWIARQAISSRIERASAKFVGDDNGDEHGARQPGPVPLGVPLGLALASLALLVWRGEGRERRSACVAGAVGVTGFALPLILSGLGFDYLDGRNLIPIFVPLFVVLGAGFAVRSAARLGIALALAFCLNSLLFAIEIDRLPRLQREDLRNAAQQVGTLKPGIAVVSNRYASSQPLRYYLGGDFARRGAPRLREVDLVGSKAAIEANAGRILPAAFHLIGSEPVSYDYTLARYRAPVAQRIAIRVLENGALVGGGGRASVLVSGNR